MGKKRSGPIDNISITESSSKEGQGYSPARCWGSIISSGFRLANCLRRQVQRSPHIVSGHAKVLFRCGAKGVVASVKILKFEWTILVISLLFAWPACWFCNFPRAVPASEFEQTITQEYARYLSTLFHSNFKIIGGVGTTLFVSSMLVVSLSGKGGVWLAVAWAVHWAVLWIQLTSYIVEHYYRLDYTKVS